MPKKRSMTKLPVVTKEWNFALEVGKMLHQIAPTSVLRVHPFQRREAKPCREQGQGHGLEGWNIGFAI